MKKHTIVITSKESYNTVGKGLFTAKDVETFHAFVKKTLDNTLPLDEIFLNSWKNENAYNNLINKIFNSLNV